MATRPEPLDPTPQPTAAPPFDVVALAASAGGIEAVSTVLKGLPQDFGATVLVLQHLRQSPSELDQILARQSKMKVAWAKDGTMLQRSQVYLCPPLQALELHPDGTCSLARLSTAYHPIDATLRSLAESFRTRAAVVVLTGMRSDGAAGAVAIKSCGGIVLAQSEDSAEQPSMPRAAIDTGAVDMVFPLSEIARALTTLSGTGKLPSSSAQVAVLDRLFGGGGVMRSILRAIDWAATPLGPVEHWSPALHTTVQTMLGIAHPSVVHWGNEHVVIYNDAYAELLGDLHPAAAGSVGAEVWRDAWPDIRSMLDHVRRTGDTNFTENAQWLLNRRGITEESYFNYSICAVHDGARRGVGILSIAIETTEQVIEQRRAALLSALASMPAVDAHENLARTLASDPREIPFALVYDVDRVKARATLIVRAGVPKDAFMAQPVIDFAGSHSIWPIDAVIDSGAPLLVSDVRSRFGDSAPGPWHEPPHEALILPVRTDDESISGVLIVGLSPVRLRRARDLNFLENVTQQVASYLTVARARSEDKLRVRALADVDRAKTEFFSNVSHEFRTPLTLAIAPIERLLERADSLPAATAAELELAHRNARRLLALVNQLLDFTRADASRLKPNFDHVDLAKETEDLVALFRSAIERAGLKLIVDCPPLFAPVRLDRGMWEKIVSNLLANALKFTFAGEIRVELRERSQHAELTVRDTGVGIPSAELPNLFERFHRVRGTRARTQEGSGIGLALARELVRLHSGQMRVKSVEGCGATFTVWIPMLSPKNGPIVAAPLARPMLDAGAIAETALSWIENKPLNAPLGEGLNQDEPFLSRTAGSRVLVADDNADMRAYLGRLLEQAGWQVREVADGATALEQLATFKPDLVLTDVMMPDIDGFELLRRVRVDPELQTMPVILVTGRAGEAAAIEGLVAGADDHITKPFTARELVARVGAQLELARIRNRNASRDAYRVKLASALRGLSDPAEIESAACHQLAQRFEATRVYYAEFADHFRRLRIHRDYHIESLPSLAGLHLAADYAPASLELAAGRPSIVHDIDGDDRFSSEIRANFRALQIVSWIGIPIVKGSAVSAIAVVLGHPHRWTEDDIQLVDETANRTWEAIARSRAEAATALAMQRSELLRGLAERVAPDSEIHALYDELIRAALELASANAGTIQIVDGMTRELVMLASNGIPAAMIEHYRRVDASSGSPCGIALANGARTFVDFSRSPDDPDAARHLAAGFRCALSTPLLARNGESLGMISVHWRELHHPDDEVLRFVGMLGRHASDLIERSQVREALRTQKAENERLRALLADRR